MGLIRIAPLNEIRKFAQCQVVCVLAGSFVNMMFMFIVIINGYETHKIKTA